MRLFVAIDIDDATRREMTRARAAITRRLRDAPVPPRVTWVRPDAAHITLRFIGEVSETLHPSITSALSSLRVSAVHLHWGVVGTFGGARRPRVIWVAPTVGGDQVAALAADIELALTPIVGAGESRPFRPHLTLGRVRDPGRDVPWHAALGDVQWAPTVTTVTSVTLYVSRLSPAGPTYTALSTHG